MESGWPYVGHNRKFVRVKGLGGIFYGADYSGYDNMKNQYETLIDIWDSLISKKQEYIDIDYGIEAQKAAEEAKKSDRRAD